MALATFTSLTPTTIPAATGGTVTITGVGFTGTTAVTVNGAPVAFSITNDTTLVLTIVTNLGGVAKISVTNASGTSSNSTLLTISAYPVPVRSSVVQLTGDFETSGTTSFATNVTGQYAFSETSLWGGSYPTSYTAYLAKAAKIKAIIQNNVRHPDQFIAIPSF